MPKFPRRTWPIVVLSLALTGCDSDIQDPPEAQNGALAVDAGAADGESPAATNKAQDDFAKKELLKEGEYAEAKQWLASKDENHRLWFKANRKTVTKMVDDFYAAGAKSVFACFAEKSDENDKLEMVASFVVELPSDDAARKTFIEAHNRFWKKYLEEDEDELPSYLITDTGQRYAVIQFD